MLENPGIRSEQIVWPGNAPDARVTITRVTMEAGAVSARHSHEGSEQIWIVERGTATLLMADGRTDALRAGDVVRTPAGVVHGVANTGAELFVYLAVTTPPQDFTPAYRGARRGG
jgi:quercetin dioxygenase-like cupin family protein